MKPCTLCFSSMYGTSQSMGGSSYRSPAASRAFLGMLNPIGRQFQGYDAASLLEEDESAELPASHHMANIASTSKSPIGPNAQNRDIGLKDSDDRSSDDEVPQSLLLEVATRSKSVQRSTSRSSRPSRPSRSSNPNPRPNPILPTSHPIRPSLPRKPPEADAATQTQTSRQTPIRKGLDGYEKALWNWINVYNIDVFLQDVYSYYEGRGIYCIALSRGLNLLFV